MFHSQRHDLSAVVRVRRGVEANLRQAFPVLPQGTDDLASDDVVGVLLHQTKEKKSILATVALNELIETFERQRLVETRAGQRRRRRRGTVANLVGLEKATDEVRPSTESVTKQPLEQPVDRTNSDEDQPEPNEKKDLRNELRLSPSQRSTFSL